MFQGTLQLTLEADGSALLEAGREEPVHFALPRAAVDQLELLLARARFSELALYHGPRIATDVPAYEIEFGGRVVRTESGSPPAPGELWALVMQLLEIANQAQNPPQLAVVLAEATLHLALTVRADGITEVDGDRQLPRALVEDVVAASAGADLTALRPGMVVRSGLRNPPPFLQLTRDFSTYHVMLDGPVPLSVAPLVEAARAAATSAEP
jgi:hypothetical protein